MITFTTQHDLSLNISHYKYLYKTWNKPASLIMLPQSYPNQGCSIICVNEYDCERFAVTLNTVDSKYTSHWYDISIFHDGVSFRSNKSNKHNEMDHHCIIWCAIMVILEWNVIDGSRNSSGDTGSVSNDQLNRWWSEAVEWLRSLSLILISHRFNALWFKCVMLTYRRGHMSSEDTSETDIWLHKTNSTIKRKWRGKQPLQGRNITYCWKGNSLLSLKHYGNIIFNQ